MTTSRERVYDSIILPLIQAGFEASIVGGAMRNTMLGVEVKDWDVATNATPDQVNAIFPNGELVGAKFGVVVVRSGDDNYEITTYRKEGAYTDHRRPDSVSFGTREEDAKRRDFTMNAIYDVFWNGGGVRFDPFDGATDIENKLIKAVGNPHERFNEDALRIMRAARFASQLGFSIESSTFDAMKAHAPDVTMISEERIKEELTKLLLGNHVDAGLKYLLNTGVMKHILPEISALRGLNRNAKFGDAFDHMVETVSNAPRNIHARLAALMLQCSKSSMPENSGYVGYDITAAEIARERLKVLRFDNDTIKIVTRIIKLHLRFKLSTSDKVIRKFIFECGDEYTYKTALDVIEANEKAYGLDDRPSWFVRRRVWSGQVKYAFNPVLPVDGFTMQDLGLKGALIGYALSKIRENWFSNPDITKDEAIKIATSIKQNPPDHLKGAK